MSHSDLNLLLDSAVRTRVPVLIWGPPGVGKSAAIQAWAKRRNLPCWTVIASLREPSDFGGLPVLDTTPRMGKDSLPTVHFAPPRFAVEAAQRGGLIFLDELTTAPPAVQAALLRAVVDKAFGDLEMDPAKVAIIAAANPPSQAAGGWDLAPPLANRFLHQTYTLNAEAWAEQFPGYWGAPPGITFNEDALSEKAWGKARTLVAAFLRSRPTLLLNVPQEESRRGQAWPSPRTWDFASRLLALAENDTEDALPLLAGCVGDGPAVEFAHWVKELDLPDPEDLLQHPESYRHPDRGDKVYAILSAVCQVAVGRLTEKRWAAAWQILSTAAQAGGVDVAAAAAKTLARSRREDLPLPVRDLAPFIPVLKAAGVL